MEEVLFLDTSPFPYFLSRLSRLPYYHRLRERGWGFDRSLTRRYRDVHLVGTWVDAVCVRLVRRDYRDALVA